MQISKHESAHVTFLKNTLTSLGVTPGANQPSILRQTEIFTFYRLQSVPCFGSGI
jgi:hypothetical protein